MIINMYETLTRRITVILLIISLSVFLSGAAAENTSTPPKKRVLILNSYHKGLSWTDNIVHGIEAELKADGREIEIYSEYMDTKRYPGKEHYRNLYETYSYKFKKYKFDIVIVNDNNALNFVIKYHGEIFPDTPVVFCGINNFQESMLTGLSLFTGVVEEIDISGTLELALALHPDTERVVSINDETTTGIAVKNEVLEIAPQFEGWVDFEFIENFNIAELKEQVWKLPRNSIILLSVVNRDRSGQFFAYEESIAHIYSESSAPIYSFWDTYLGKGIVGGRLTTGYHQGKTAAQIALRILNGADVKTIPVVRDSPNKYMFDHQQLKLFNISESGLPQDSIIINVPDTLYSRNKTLFLSGLFTISSLIMIIGVLLIMMSYRKKMEAVLRDSEQRYRDFYENAPDMYHSINKDGTVIDCNETEARMLGYKKEEIIGRPVSDFFTEKTKKIYEKEFPDLKNRSVHLDVEREFVRRDGSTFTASLNISTEIDENGELIKTKTIARDLTERRRVEELKKSQEQLRSLSAHLESAREKEKKRIARQIHDELGHVLTTLSLDLSWLNNRLSNKSEAFDTDLIMDRTQAMSDLIESTVQTVQRISSELIPGVLDHLGLAEAIKWQTDKFRARTGITYNVIIDSDRMMLDQQSSIAVFRIFQETLTNIARHAEATEVTVALQEEDDIMTLEISDNGIGIQDSQISSPESVGLIGIRERARILGGKASISGSPNGTSVKLVIPINGTKGDE
jgi:PAS domain S-box-containing protein